MSLKVAKSTNNFLHGKGEYNEGDDVTHLDVESEELGRLGLIDAKTVRDATDEEQEAHRVLHSPKSITPVNSDTNAAAPETKIAPVTSNKTGSGAAPAKTVSKSK